MNTTEILEIRLNTGNAKEKESARFQKIMHKILKEANCSSLILDDISLTFDFIELVKNNTNNNHADTYERVINNILFTNEEVRNIEKIIFQNNKSILEIKQALDNSVYDSFKLHAIMRGNAINKKDKHTDLLDLIYQENLERLKTLNIPYNFTYRNGKNYIVCKKADTFNYQTFLNYMHVFYETHWLIIRESEKGVFPTKRDIEKEHEDFKKAFI